MEQDSPTVAYLPGQVVEGEITNVTNFGAFVRLGDGQEGLIHISEIADDYITDINEYVERGQKVTVLILEKNQKNKLDLSIKKANKDSKIPEMFVKKISKDEEFESKLTKFLKKSEEKQIDIRRNLKFKQGIKKKK